MPGDDKDVQTSAVCSRAADMRVFGGSGPRCVPDPATEHYRPCSVAAWHPCGPGRSGSTDAEWVDLPMLATGPPADSVRAPTDRPATTEIRRIPDPRRSSCFWPPPPSRTSSSS
jgi:hypothetical protein